MKPGLEIGHTYEFTVRVREEMKACFDDVVVHPLYSTASMIAHMEWAARQHILPYLETGEEGAGYHVDVKHLRPTPIGAEVRVRSTVTAIEPRRVTSAVEAWHETIKIGEGTIVQALVPLETLYACYQDKASQPTDTEEALTSLEPACLRSPNDSAQFSLTLLKWESDFLPCTRYDEWLVCRLHLDAEPEHRQYEGACLLRHEIEDWVKAIQTLLQNQTDYRSDFLEPVLNITMRSAAETGRYQLDLTLTVEGTPLNTQWLLEAEVLNAFSRQLSAQLDAFPSLL